MGKGLFGKKGKDDKLQEELDQAKKEAEGAKKALKDMMNHNTQTKQAKAEAEKKIAEMEKQIKGMKQEKSREEMAEARQKAVEERRAKLESVKKSEVMTTHTVQEGETLSHVALKYYQHATPKYWKFLLEHNTEVLKGNERNVRAGMELEIPELPEDLED